MAKAVIDMRIFGDKKLTRKFTRLSVKLQKKHARKALRAGAKMFATAWKARMPAATGAMRRGTKVRAMKRSRSRIGFVARTPTRKELGIAQDEKYYYPAVIEFGGVTETGRVIPPQAPGRRALKATRDKALAKVSDILWDGVRKEARK